jgi:hypothetical protein
LRIHGSQSASVLRLHSENRDELWAQRVAQHADVTDAAFGELARRRDNSLDRELEKLKFLGAGGPNALDAPTPSDDAIDLAYAFARLSIPPLRAAILEGGGRILVAGGVWWLAAPEVTETEMASGVPALPDETPYGIPLLAACSPEAVPAEHNALAVGSRWLVARNLDPLQQLRQDFSARLTRLIAVEHRLWQLAGAHGGPSDRIPYAFRFRTLERFWTPSAHAPGLDACTLCLRCGDLISPSATGRPRRALPPLCAHCAKEPRATRQWPDHAVAPDGPGRWWLTCCACRNLFVAQRQARRCPECRLSAISPGRRAVGRGRF